MKSDNLILKVRYKDELRRVAIPCQDLDCNVLNQKIADMFPNLNNKFKCYYDDGDKQQQELKESYFQWLEYATFDGKYPLLRILIKEEDEDTQEIENVEEDEEEEEEEEFQEIKDELMLPIADICTNCAIYLTNEIRYKCLMCRHVLLCNSCAHPSAASSDSVPSHPADHLLVELRSPIAALTLLQKLILLRYVEESDRATAKQLRKIRRKLRKKIKKEHEENKKLKEKKKKKKKKEKKEKELETEEKQENDDDDDNNNNNIINYVVLENVIVSEIEIPDFKEEEKRK